MSQKKVEAYKEYKKNKQKYMLNLGRPLAKE